MEAKAPPPLYGRMLVNPALRDGLGPLVELALMGKANQNPPSANFAPFMLAILDKDNKTGAMYFRPRLRDANKALLEDWNRVPEDKRAILIDGWHMRDLFHIHACQFMQTRAGNEPTTFGNHIKQRMHYDDQRMVATGVCSPQSPYAGAPFYATIIPFNNERALPHTAVGSQQYDTTRGISTFWHAWQPCAFADSWFLQGYATDPHDVLNEKNLYRRNYYRMAVSMLVSKWADMRANLAQSSLPPDKITALKESHAWPLTNWARTYDTLCQWQTLSSVLDAHHSSALWTQIDAVVDARRFYIAQHPHEVGIPQTFTNRSIEYQRKHVLGAVLQVPNSTEYTIGRAYTSWVFMENLAGGNLNDWIVAHPYAVFSANFLGSLLVQTLAPLMLAQRTLKLVHMDMKLDNLMMYPLPAAYRSVPGLVLRYTFSGNVHSIVFDVPASATNYHVIKIIDLEQSSVDLRLAVSHATGSENVDTALAGLLSVDARNESVTPDYNNNHTRWVGSMDRDFTLFVNGARELGIPAFYNERLMHSENTYFDAHRLALSLWSLIFGMGCPTQYRWLVEWLSMPNGLVPEDDHVLRDVRAHMFTLDTHYANADVERSAEARIKAAEESAKIKEAFLAGYKAYYAKLPTDLQKGLTYTPRLARAYMDFDAVRREQQAQIRLVFVAASNHAAYGRIMETLAALARTHVSAPGLFHNTNSQTDDLEMTEFFATASEEVPLVVHPELEEGEWGWYIDEITNYTFEKQAKYKAEAKKGGTLPFSELEWYTHILSEAQTLYKLHNGDGERNAMQKYMLEQMKGFLVKGDDDRVNAMTELDSAITDQDKMTGELHFALAYALLPLQLIKEWREEWAAILDSYKKLAPNEQREKNKELILTQLDLIRSLASNKTPLGTFILLPDESTNMQKYLYRKLFPFISEDMMKEVVGIVEDALPTSGRAKLGVESRILNMFLKLVRTRLEATGLATKEFIEQIKSDDRGVFGMSLQYVLQTSVDEGEVRKGVVEFLRRHPADTVESAAPIIRRVLFVTSALSKIQLKVNDAIYVFGDNGRIGRRDVLLGTIETDLEKLPMTDVLMMQFVHSSMERLVKLLYTRNDLLSTVNGLIKFYQECILFACSIASRILRSILVPVVVEHYQTAKSSNIYNTQVISLLKALGAFDNSVNYIEDITGVENHYVPIPPEPATPDDTSQDVEMRDISSDDDEEEEEEEKEKEEKSTEQPSQITFFDIEDKCLRAFEGCDNLLFPEILNARIEHENDNNTEKRRFARDAKMRTLAAQFMRSLPLNQFERNKHDWLRLKSTFLILHDMCHKHEIFAPVKDIGADKVIPMIHYTNTPEQDTSDADDLEAVARIDTLYDDTHAQYEAERKADDEAAAAAAAAENNNASSAETQETKRAKRQKVKARLIAGLLNMEI